MLFSVLLTWSEPVPLNVILNRYTIRYSVNGSSEITNTTRDTTISITDLNPNTVVSNIRVIAATGAGDGPPQMLNEITTLDRPCEYGIMTLFLLIRYIVFCSFVTIIKLFLIPIVTQIETVLLLVCLSTGSERACLVRLHKALIK